MSTEKLSTGMPEVFETESSFVRRKLSLEMSAAAIGTNGSLWKNSTLLTQAVRYNLNKSTNKIQRWIIFEYANNTS